MSRRKRKSDGLVSKVLKIPKGLIISEDKIRYIPWCEYFPHMGIIKDKEVCEKRKCKHYYKLYLK